MKHNHIFALFVLIAIVVFIAMAGVLVISQTVKEVALWCIFGRGLFSLYFIQYAISSDKKE